MRQNEYRQLKVSKPYDKAIIQRLPSLIQTAKFFVENVLEKEFLFISETEKLKVIFTRADFYHFCGVQYSRGVKHWLDDLIDNRVDLANVKVKVDGTTRLKWEVLSAFSMLFTTETKIVDGSIRLKMRYDKMLRTKKMIIGVALVRRNNSRVFPLSLLNLRTLRLKDTNSKNVVCIVSRDLRTNEKIIIDKKADFLIKDDDVNNFFDN